MALLVTTNARCHAPPFSIRQPVPVFRLPLQTSERPESLVDLTPLLHALYDRAGYDLRLDDRAAPPRCRQLSPFSNSFRASPPPDPPPGNP
ncbi:MAG: DUF4058 family protein [Chloroflexaceae bacterium]|nr:DUF4058 family protein [Chloroflexaceae bacterium]